MTNWTDPIIHWNQLPGTEVKRLLATWGMDEKAIARYDAKHGYEHRPLAVPAPAKAVASKPAVAVVPKAPAKKAAPARPAARQTHTGVDGEVKFVAHRNLFVGFMDGKVVVTKRTREQCLEVLRNEYKQEV
jgi:hypothetical protein